MTRARLLVAGAALAALAVVIVLLTRGSSSPAAPSSGPATAGRDPRPRAGLELPTLEHVPAPVLQYDDDPAGDHRLEGQVIDDDEQPVAGATVVVDANPPREVQTEPDGSFAFDGLTPRTYRIEARAGDGVAGPVGVPLSASSEPVVLRLRDAARVVVEVRRADRDVVIAGALVELRDLALVGAVTDESGLAVLRGIGGGWHTVKVSAGGFAAHYAEITSSGVAGSETRLSVRLRAGGTVAGTVVDAAGAPVEGARVLAEGASREDELFDPRLDGVVTDAKGRWRLAGLPRESLRFRAHHARFAPGVTPPLPLGDGVDREGITITLERGARVRGRVVDAAGAPAPGAEVRLVGDGYLTGLVRRVACDAAGNFEMTGLPRRLVRLIAMADGASSPIETLDLAATGEPDAIELQLDQVDAIAGVVVTSSGQPVAEARVVAERVSSDDPLERVGRRLRGPTGAIADGDGRFALSGLARGTYLLRAVRPGSTSDLLDMKPGLHVETGALDARIEVDDLAALTGKVAFADGTVPHDFSIELGSAPPRWSSDPGGVFRIDGVPAGAQFVRVDGPELVAEAIKEVVITADGVTDLGTITVRRGRRVAGIVVDDAGRPVAGAQVVVSRQLDGDGSSLVSETHPDLEQTVSGDDGRFSIRGVGPGLHVVAADHDDAGRSETQELAPGSADAQLTLTVRPTGAVQGFVRLRGQPAEAAVMLRPAGAANAGFEVRTGPDGSYRLDRIAAGKYVHWTRTVRGSRQGGSDGTTRTIVVVAGQVLDVDVDLDPSGVTVVLQMASPGDAVEYGYGFMGSLDAPPPSLPTTISEARGMLTSVDNLESREGLIVKDRRIELRSIRLGLQIACIAPLRGDPEDPAVIAELQGNLVDWPVYCAQVTIAATPAIQEISVEVQPLAP